MNFAFNALCTHLKRRLADYSSGRGHRKDSTGVLISLDSSVAPLTADTSTGQRGHDVNYS